MKNQIECDKGCKSCDAARIALRRRIDEVTDLQKQIDAMREENARIKDRSKLFFRLTTEAVYILDGLSREVGLTPFILIWIKDAKRETHTKKSPPESPRKKGGSNE